MIIIIKWLNDFFCPGIYNRPRQVMYSFGCIDRQGPGLCRHCYTYRTNVIVGLHFQGYAIRFHMYGLFILLLLPGCGPGFPGPLEVSYLYVAKLSDMNKLQLGQRVRFTDGPTGSGIIIGFYSNGAVVATPSEFAMVAASFVSPALTIHHSLLVPVSDSGLRYLEQE
jgi:hypothetical protein